MESIRKPRFTLSALTLAVAASPGVMAQQLVLEEVIVTAQKREQSLQDVPIAVSAMSGETIDDVGIRDLEELTLYIPNVNINQGQATANLFIRGVGSGSNLGFEQSVGLYIDGIYSGRGQLARVPLTLDLQRVEVLKGPQDILFGKNTIAGAINITSRRPSQDFEAYVEGLWEPEDNEQVYTGVINGALTDKLAGRLAVRYEGMDGWWENEFLDEEGPDRDNLFVRASIAWDASDTVEVLAKYEHGDFEVVNRPQVVYQSDQPENFLGQQPFPVIDDRDKGAGDVAEGDETDVDVLAITVNWDNDLGTLTSVSGYATYDTFLLNNSDFAATPSFNQTKDEDYAQFSQELRLVSPGGETLDWIAGAYFQKTELEINRVYTDADFALSGPLSVPAFLLTTDERVPTRFEQDSTSWALFGEVTWALTDAFRLALGLRYNEEDKDLDKVNRTPGGAARAGVGSPAADLIFLANPANRGLVADLRSHSFTGLEREEEKVTWSTKLIWDATDSTMYYASASTGFKGGGFDEQYSGAGPLVRTADPLTGELDGGVIETGIDSSILEYEDETVLTYEIGGKLTLADGAANLNFAVFRMEYEDLQVSALVGDAFRVTNAGESVSQGVEIDGRWLLAEGFTLGGAIAWLDAFYDDFDTAPCTIPQVTDPAGSPGCLRSDGSNIAAGEEGSQDLTDETLLYAPDWSANFNAEWILGLSDRLEIRTNLDVNYTDSFYSALDLDPNTEHDSATNVNLRVALASVSDNWSLAIIGKNLTDEETMVWRTDVPLTGGSNSYYGVPERGRSVALQARYRF